MKSTKLIGLLVILFASFIGCSAAPDRILLKEEAIIIAVT